jgi:hypothetical protein
MLFDRRVAVNAEANTYGEEFIFQPPLFPRSPTACFRIENGLSFSASEIGNANTISANNWTLHCHAIPRTDQ